MVTGVLYSLFASAELMPWNDAYTNELKEAVELRYIENCREKKPNEDEKEAMLKSSLKEENEKLT